MKIFQLLIICALFLGSCENSDSENEQEFIQAEETEISENLALTGIIRAGKTTEIRPEITGKIIEILTHEKDSITKGQVLFRVLPYEFLEASDSIQKILVVAKNELLTQKQNLETVKNKLLKAKRNTPNQLTEVQKNYQTQAKILETSRFQVVSLEESLQILEENTTPVEIPATETGILKKINVSDNERVFKTDSTGTQIAKVWAEVVSTQHFDFEAETENSAVTWLQKGDLAKVELSFEKEQFKGTVQEIISLSEQKYQLIINLEQSKNNQKTRAGMTAIAEIPIEKKKVLFLPISCLKIEENHKTVIIKDSEGKTIIHEVKIGIQKADKIEIRQGITIKDWVLKNYQTTTRQTN